MASIYLSYRMTDEQIARELTARLIAGGHRVTVDTNTLMPGQQFRTVLRDALKTSDCVVALLSKDAHQSQYVFTEIGAARALDKLLIPVVIDDAPMPNVIADILCVFYRGNLDEVVQKINQSIDAMANRNVFIVHGHDEAKKWELKNFLGSLRLNPLILHEQDSAGMTIIEKFERYAAQANFAFILMTPDDASSTSDATEAKWRARQNVILELGWFMAKLGRQRVVILYRGTLDIPSDILGVVYLKFTDNILEVGEQIRQRLRGAGLLT